MDGNTADADKAALIISQEIRPILIGGSKNHKKIPTAIEPVSGFLWPRELIRQTATGPINGSAHCLKGACVNHKAIREFRHVAKTNFGKAGITIPEGWEIWRPLTSQ